jgi:xanthine dehydrogenase accessory factor
MTPATLILRGGGDLASGVALRCLRAGLQSIITEIPQPLAVRRTVAFAEAMYTGLVKVEEATARRANTLEEVQSILQAHEIPVLCDPSCDIRHKLPPAVLIDARMMKHSPEIGREAAPLVIGLGPGFHAGENCHAVIETNRGHFLGRVIWNGTAQPDTGIPEGVAARESAVQTTHQAERVLRSPRAGILNVYAEIGTIIEAGQPIAQVGNAMLCAPFRGLLRGIMHAGVFVQAGMKIGDLDPRCDPRHALYVSEKALAIGGGVLEAILSRPDIRQMLWG